MVARVAIPGLAAAEDGAVIAYETTLDDLCGLDVGGGGGNAA